MNKFIFIFVVGLFSDFVFAEVCTTTDTLTSHEHGCLRGDLLWSAPLGRNVDSESAKSYCSELPAVPDEVMSWRLPTESEILDLVKASPHRSFSADLDNLFWTSGDAMIHPIVGNRVMIRGESIVTNVICVLQYGKFPDCDHVNSLGMRFCRIPAGTFMMGTPEGEDGRYDFEGPQHLMTISNDFEMLSTEVTQAMWREICGVSCGAGQSPSFYEHHDHPVEKVSWNDITEQFLPALNKKLRGENYTYRLPTEAEWERAVRGLKASPFGVDGDLKDFGWIDILYPDHHRAVGKLKPNRFGLFDMHGNVQDWVQDKWSIFLPNAVIEPIVTDEGLRVLRGCGYGESARNCRSGYRHNLRSHYEAPNIGFRLVRTKN